ncbi:hypothetical protein KP509_21G079000 [Ceratopteris richardii]|nr:hypothetical protein KP509_21G079000 [Ceratopteris richardii]
MNQRQLLSPTFFMRELKDNFGIIKATVKDYLECLCTHDTAVVDVHKIFSTLAVKLIYQVAFGESLDDKSAFMVYKRFDNYLHQRKHAFCGPFFNLFGFRWKSWGSVEDETYLLRVIRELVSTRRQRSSSQCTKAKLAIDILIEDLERCEKSGSNVVLDNSATLLLAGHETTANLVTWAVYLLGTHLNLQDEARLEVQGIKDLDMKNVSQLKVLGMILWETLRLYPPQPLIGRRCIEDNTVNGVFVPKDMEVIIPVSAIHRSVDLWGHDSEDFKPYRFANGINKAYRVPSSFLPFGSGPRTCIGQSLALLEAKTILYYMLKHYSWEISPGYQHFPDVTLTLLPRFGMPILLFRL